MNQSFTLRLRFLNQGSFAYGTTVDHIVVSLTGPTSVPPQTLGANVQYVTFGPNMAPGTYLYSIQAYDPTGALLGTAATGSVSYNPFPLGVLSIPTRLNIVGAVYNGTAGGGPYILQENGGRILLENNSGAILLG